MISADADAVSTFILSRISTARTRPPDSLALKLLDCGGAWTGHSRAVGDLLREKRMRHYLLFIIILLAPHICGRATERVLYPQSLVRAAERGH